MAFNVMCMNSTCKYYWEDSCTRDLKDERIIIDAYGLCESFKEGKSDWYKEGEE